MTMVRKYFLFAAINIKEITLLLAIKWAEFYFPNVRKFERVPSTYLDFAREYTFF